MRHPLYVAFVWHMHQPYYRDVLTGDYSLPWVRLHAAKDYVHMGEVLARYPNVHQTFNLVPSLIEQLQDYANGGATDRHLRLSLATERSIEDKLWMLEHFFSINSDRFIQPHPRYRALLRLREELRQLGLGPPSEGIGPSVRSNVELLSDAYWHDLAVWFNLAWIDPTTIASDPELAALVERGQAFSAADLRLVLAKHRELCGRVVPLYRKLADRGQVELTTTPYYHPILPLLVDTCSARDASPGLPIPNIRFAHPEDALAQLDQAVRFHASTFGQEPAGLWPSEGAVSQEAVELIARFPNFRWLATDEGILARSLGQALPRDQYGHLHDPRPLYQPYQLAAGPAAVFRDQVLSDRVGFVYQHWDSRDAANDLIHRLERMAAVVEHDHEPHLVAIILDGENCWESYPNNGEDFLSHLYARLSDHPRLRTVAVGEYLESHSPRRTLPRIATGSWIGANLETWVGESAQNRGWEYLALARSAAERGLGVGRWGLGNEDASLPNPLARAVGIAEGSDWFWWYYSRNRFGQEDTFDVQFRRHLANIYRLLDQSPPPWLERPVLGPEPARERAITSYVQPRLGLESRAAAEWAGAGAVEPILSSGVMQRGASRLSRLLYGYSTDALCLRVEGADLDQWLTAFYLATSGQPHGNLVSREDASHVETRFGWKILVSAEMDGAVLFTARAEGGWELRQRWYVGSGDGVRRPAGKAHWAEAGGRANVWAGPSEAGVAASGGVVELVVPIADLNLRFGDRVELLAAVLSDLNESDLNETERLLETVPAAGVVAFTLLPQG